MANEKTVARTREEMIVEVWQELDCPTVGAEVIEEIQSELRERFGAGGILLPMRIARVLAEAGAELMHPDVIELDAKQRAATFEAGDPEFELNFDGLRQAEESIVKLEELRSMAGEPNEMRMLTEARNSAMKTRDRFRSDASNPKIDELVRRESAEIAEWLRVWLTTPDLFADWLKLRKRSTDFRSRFGRRGE